MKPGMKQLTRVGWLMAAVVLTAATDTRAQNPLTTSVVGSFTVGPKVVFSFDSSPNITFPNSDPDAVHTITATPVAFHLQVHTPNPMQVLIYAGGPLVSGSDTIDLTNMTFECNVPALGSTPPTPIRTSQQTLMTFNSGDYTGTVTFKLANQWTYASGTYTTTVTLTMTAQ